MEREPLHVILPVNALLGHGHGIMVVEVVLLTAVTALTVVMENVIVVKTQQPALETVELDRIQQLHLNQLD